MSATVQYLDDFSHAHQINRRTFQHEVLDLQHVKSQTATFVEGMEPHSRQQERRALGLVPLKRLAMPRKRDQQPGAALGNLPDLLD